MVGIPVFGGIDPVTSKGGFCNVFDEGMNVAKCIVAWGKVGVIRLTMKCLESHKVCPKLRIRNAKLL